MTPPSWIWEPRVRIGPYALGSALPTLGTMNLVGFEEYGEDSSKTAYYYEDEHGHDVEVVEGVVVAVWWVTRAEYRGVQIESLTPEAIGRLLDCEPDVTGPYTIEGAENTLYQYWRMGLSVTVAGDGSVRHMVIKRDEW